MTDTTWVQFLSILLGGLLTIAGGITTTTVLEKQRQTRDSRSLALAFKGEITALLEFIQERGYTQRFHQVIDQIESTGTPFLMPFHVRFRYDRVYDSNVSRIGLLRGDLPQQVPLFYTRLTSMIEDMVNLGDGAYAGLDLPVLLRIYRDLLSSLEKSHTLGKQIIEEVNRQYGES